MADPALQFPATSEEEHDNKFGTKKVSPFLDDGQGNIVRQSISGFNLPLYDELDFGYTGVNLTSIQYKKSGTLLATLTLGYDGANNLTSIVKS